eukprot:jgi/Mesvir1/17910/Mv12975-RA.1
MTGEGLRVWADGRKYTGMFLQGHLHGMGTMEQPNGDKYAGQWDTNQRQGEGTLEYGNGDTYQGHFSAHFPEGLGTLRAKDGSVFEGEWVRGQQSGSGACRYANGDVFEGMWEGGQWKHGRWYQCCTNITYNGLFEGGVPSVRPTLLHVLRVEAADASSEGKDARPPTSSGGASSAVPSVLPGHPLPRIIVGCLKALPTPPPDASGAISPQGGAKAGAKGSPAPAKAAPKTPGSKGAKDAGPTVGLLPTGEELVALEPMVVTAESGRKIVATLHVGPATAGAGGAIALGKRIAFLSSTFPPSHELVEISANGLVNWGTVGVPADCDGGPYTICFRNVVDESLGVPPLQPAYLAIQVDGPSQPKGGKAPAKKAPATPKK